MFCPCGCGAIDPLNGLFPCRQLSKFCGAQVFRRLVGMQQTSKPPNSSRSGPCNLGVESLWPYFPKPIWCDVGHRWPFSRTTVPEWRDSVCRKDSDRFIIPLLFGQQFGDLEVNEVKNISIWHSAVHHSEHSSFQQVAGCYEHYLSSLITQRPKQINLKRWTSPRMLPTVSPLF